MTEAALLVEMRHALRAAPHRFERVENRLATGFPDTVYTLDGHCGLLELKAIDRGSLSVERPLVVGSLTAEQVAWAVHWTQGGGLYRLLLRTKRPRFYHWFDVDEVRRLYKRELLHGSPTALGRTTRELTKEWLRSALLP